MDAQEQIWLFIGLLRESLPPFIELPLRKQSPRSPQKNDPPDQKLIRGRKPVEAL